MVFFLNNNVKTHTADALQYIFDENKAKIVILGYSIVLRRSPLRKPLKKNSLNMGIARFGWTPPLFWALAEHFLCVNCNILQNPTKQRKRYSKPIFLLCWNSFLKGNQIFWFFLKTNLQPKKRSLCLKKCLSHWVTVTNIFWNTVIFF